MLKYNYNASTTSRESEQGNARVTSNILKGINIGYHIIIEISNFLNEYFLGLSQNSRLLISPISATATC